MIDNRALVSTGVGSTTRYEVLTKIATGGMASVYLAALKGPFGFEQLVAIKRLHQHLLDEPSVRESLLVEARVAARIRHANVVDVRDVEVLDDTIQLVMTYVEGASLAQLMMSTDKIPVNVTLRIMLDACAGLHAAHQLTDEHGRPFGVVHRDISPQNILVGVDGAARITDFGVARDDVVGRLRTNTGHLKGKFAYMAPEYILGQKLDRRSDVFALGVVCWEALAGRRLFKGTNDADTICRVTTHAVPAIGKEIPALGGSLDDILSMALSKNPDTRFSSAEAFGAALEAIAVKTDMLATRAEVSRHVRKVAREDLARLAEVRRTAAERISGPAEPAKSATATTSAQTVIAPPPARLLAKSKPDVDEGGERTRVVAANVDLSDPTTRRRLDMPRDAQSDPPETLDVPTIMSVPDTLPAGEASFRHPAPVMEPTPAVPVLSAASVAVADRSKHVNTWEAVGPKGTFVMPNGQRRQTSPSVLTMRSPSRSDAGAETRNPLDSNLPSPSLEACLHDSPRRFGKSRASVNTLPFLMQGGKRNILPFKSGKTSVGRRKILLIVAVCVVLATSAIISCIMLIGSSHAHDQANEHVE